MIGHQKFSHLLHQKILKATVLRLSEFKNHREPQRSYPQVFLMAFPMNDLHSSKPLEDVFSDPDFAYIKKSWIKAIKRYQSGDFSGCVTSCASAIEGTVKAIAQKKNLKLKGNGVGKIVKSLIENTDLPQSLSKIASYYADRRQHIGDAHSNPDLPKVKDAEIQFIVSLTSAVIVYLSSQE